MKTSRRNFRATGAMCLFASLLLFTPAGFGAVSPSITTQPQNKTVATGTNATFSVVATGQSPLAYRWSLNGTNLTNSAHISGATATTLTVSNVIISDAGNYGVVVTNSHGSATSSNAILTVGNAPTISPQPQSQIRIVGGVAIFSSGATGTSPISYRWFFNNAPLTNSARIFGATTTSLTVSNLQMADAGNYKFVVTNAFGSVTSSICSLAIFTNSSGIFRCVNINNPTPAPPYNNWNNAATNIQDAINAANSGEKIFVTNGFYGFSSSSNIVSVNFPLSLISMSGPAQTIIDGGGTTPCVYLADGSLLSGFTVTNGTSTQSGGGILCQSTNVVITNCVVTGSYADVQGGGVYGGVLLNCSLIHNSAAGLSGPQNYLAGGAASSSVLSNCVVTGNLTGDHSALYGQGAGLVNCTADRCVITNNSSLYSGAGGAAYSTLNNCLVANNFAGGWGGGAINSTLNNCTVVSNTVQYSSGAGVHTCTVNNSIIYDNILVLNIDGTTDQTNHALSTLNYSCTTPMPTNGTGNITNPPQFMNEAGGDFHLYPGSPCINAGNNASTIGTLDLDGNTRIVNTTVDIGAFEFLELPFITSQPISQSVFFSDPLSFSVTAFGNAAFSYQWRFNGTNIVGETNSTLSRQFAQFSDAGNYSVLVMNSFGATLSSNASLAVNSPLPGVPHIGSFSPHAASVGATVNLWGTNFSPVAASNVVFFGAVRANVVSASETNLVVTVPVGATYAPITVMVNGLVGYAPAPFQPTFLGDGESISASTFTARADMTGTYGNFQSLLSDLDGDGKPDFVFSVNHTFAVFRNTGTTNTLPTGFAPRLDISTGNSDSNSGFIAADVDGDGKPDLVFCDNANSRVGILKNVSTPGTLASNSFAPAIYFSVPNAPIYARVQDLDFDGKPEISVACGGGVSIFKNLSSPGILDTGSLGGRIDLASGAGAYDVAVQDLDGDGKPDLAVTHQSSAFISIFRNVATPGTLAVNSFEPKVDFPSLNQNFTILAADIDGDGKPELLTGGKGSTLQVYQNLSTPGSFTSNSFSAPWNFGHPGWVHNIAMGDINGDGKSDIIIVGELGSYMRINQNRSTPGTFNAGSITPIDFSTGWNPWGVSVGDIDGDGRADVAFCNNYDGAITFYKNATPFGGPPTVSIQPTNTFLPVGSNFVLTASTSGQLPLIYQWIFNGAPLTNDARISGTTTNSLAINNAQTNDSGSYQLVLSNSFGVVTSDVASVSIVILPPAISQQPQSQFKAVGSNVVMTTTISGTPPYSFQWFFNDSPLSDGGRISGANSNTLNISSVQTNDTGNYYLIVTNVSGAATSAVATLDIGIPPSISLQPSGQTNLTGSNVTFTVAADGTAPLNFLWRLNGANLADNSRINGSTNSTLTISNLLTSDAGNYDIIITNSVGSITSSVAVLAVYQLPTFTTQPIGRSIVPGLPASFTANVTGTTPFSFQWQLNGTNILNATNLTYSITAVSSNDFGIYNLVASNTAGVTISADTPLTYGQIVVWGNSSAGQNIVPPGATNIVMICAGNQSSGVSHSLALRADGTVFGWGNNTYGEASPPASLSNVVSIACGVDHSVALRADGTVFAWGNNTFGQLNVPPGLSNVVAIAAGSLHSLALRSDGKVFAWGSNSSGQTNVPATLNKVVAIAAGVTHSLAIRFDGTVVAWGRNNDDRQVAPGPSTVPAGISNVVSMAGGNTHNIGLLSNLTVFGWGNTNFGLQVIPTNSTRAIAVAAAADFSMALRTNGTVAVWGSNSSGQTNVPSVVSNAIAIAAGCSHAVALLGDGRPVIQRQPVGGTTFVGRDYNFNSTVSGNDTLNFQWQFNGTDIPNATNASLALNNLSVTNTGEYRLVVSNSLGLATSVPVPLTVLNNPGLTFLSQLPGAQTNYQGAKIILNLGVSGNGPLKYQWKLNSTNIPGATNADFVFDPILVTNTGNYTVLVSNLVTSATSISSTQRVFLVKAAGFSATDPTNLITNAVSLAVGNPGAGPSGGHYLVLRSDGKITSWGSSQTGSYGETTPPPSISNSIATAISAGFYSSMALRSDGIPIAWGYPSYGISNAPPNANSIIAIASGDYHELALRGDGSVVAWGNNSSGQTNVPPTATNVVAIAAGAQHSLALRANGTVVGWGNNGSGQTTVPFNATNVIALAGGSGHSIALRADGTVVQWGSGLANYPVPSGLSNVVAISSSLTHNVALRSDGTVTTWGFYYASTTNFPTDFANVIQIASGGDHDLVLFGTRAPAITINPYSRNLFKGSNTLFAAKASGVQPMTYQWKINGTNILNATNDTLSLTNLQFAQSGSYQLSVSNSYGVATSKAGKLVVSLPLGDSVDQTQTAFTSSGAAQWFGQTDVTHDGIDAARSGAISDGQETILQTSIVKSSGQVAFWWKVSSESGFDFLEFRINGVVQASISGEVDWERRVFSAPDLAVLQWRYYKDNSGSGGQDAAWVDQIAFVPNAPVFATQPVAQTVNMGSNVTFTVSLSATSTGPFTYIWKRDQTNGFANNSPFMNLNPVSRALSGNYTVTVTNLGGSVTSSNAFLKVLIPQNLGAPTLLPDGTLQFVSVDADGGQHSPSDLTNLELQASADLLSWETLSNSLTLTNGMLYFRDADQTNFSSRYYRILEH